MALIKEYLENILSAIYGEEVRSSIHDAIKQCYDDATGNPASIAAYAKIVTELQEQLAKDEKIFTNINSVFEVSENYIRIGNSMIVWGYAYLLTNNGFSAEGNIYAATASFDDSVTNYTRKQKHEIEIVGSFPAAFTDTPFVSITPSGSESPMWLGKAICDNAGLQAVKIYRPSASSGNKCSTQYIAIGRTDGSNRAGAEVITKGLKFVGLQKYNGIALEEYFLNKYAELIGSSAQENTGWCSEFACVNAIEAGISESIFPRFKSAPKGSIAFSNIGCFYLRTGTGKNVCFKHATFSGSSTAGYSTSLVADGTKYIPKIGDVLWTCADKWDATNDDGWLPSHTELVTSVDINLEAETPIYKIYTLAGNLNVYADGANGADDEPLYKTVVRKVRDIAGSKITGNRVVAIGRVAYPARYTYPSNISGSSGGIGGSGSGNYAVASEQDIMDYLGIRNNKSDSGISSSDKNQ